MVDQKGRGVHSYIGCPFSTFRRLFNMLPHESQPSNNYDARLLTIQSCNKTSYIAITNFLSDI